MSEVTVASTSELPEVAAFYATCGYGGGISQADTVLVSRICGQLVGVVRLCPQEGVVVLRGMQVHKPTPLATYRFHGSRASPGKRRYRPCGFQVSNYPTY